MLRSSSSSVLLDSTSVEKEAERFRKSLTKGDTRSMRKSLRKGGLLTYTDKLGRNWLHLAATHSQYQSFRFLLEYRMDPCTQHQQKWTPLHAACSVGDSEIVELLIDAYRKRKLLCEYMKLSTCPSDAPRRQTDQSDGYNRSNSPSPCLCQWKLQFGALFGPQGC